MIILAAVPQSAAPSSTGTSCAPVNCQIQCNPACASDMTCSLTTMNQCGVCPVPVCISKSLATSSGSSGSSTSGSNAGLLPGLIGGLVGLLAIALIAFGFFRYKRRKAQGLPFWKSGDSQSETSEHWVNWFLKFPNYQVHVHITKPPHSFFFFFFLTL